MKTLLTVLLSFLVLFASDAKKIKLKKFKAFTRIAQHGFCVIAHGGILANVVNVTSMPGKFLHNKHHCCQNQNRCFLLRALLIV